MESQHITIGRLGGPETLELRSGQVAPPQGDGVLVRVAAAGVSYGDVLQRYNVIPGSPKPPFTPGFDVSGVVESVGDRATEFTVGQRVAGLIRHGGYSKYVEVPAGRLVEIPEGTRTIDVAATSLNYFVAYQMLHRVVQVKPGQRILVHGAAGGVGTALLQLARLADVECYGTSSQAKKDLVTELGAEHIDYRNEDFVNILRDRHPGGLDAAFDPVGGTHFWRSYKVLRRGGSLVAYGQSQALQNGKASRPIGAIGFLGGIAAPKFFPDGRSTTFYNAWSLDKSHPTAYREDLSEVLRLLSAGEIRPIISETFPLADAAKAHELLESNVVRGKLVLTCE